MGLITIFQLFEAFFESDLQRIQMSMAIEVALSTASAITTVMFVDLVTEWAMHLQTRRFVTLKSLAAMGMVKIYYTYIFGEFLKDIKKF